MLSIAIFQYLIIACTNPTNDSGQHSPFSLEEQGHLDYMSLDISVPIEEDSSNQYRYDEATIRFGETLFSSTILSKNGEIACASCHQIDNYFTDSLSLSQGLQTTRRSAPTLLGLQRQRWFNWDGACDSAWCQAIGPLEKDGEMGTSRIALAHTILEHYKTDYEAIFGTLPPNIADWPTEGKPTMEEWEQISESIQIDSTQILVNVAKAIDAYEYTLSPPKRRLDDFFEQYREDQQSAFDFLSSVEQKGLDLFLNEGRCVLCHAGPTLSNGEFHNIGLGMRDWLDPLDIGRYDGIDSLRNSTFNSAGIWSDDSEGIKAKRISRLNQKTEQLGQFKTPTLREIGNTAPYMHGGHFETLDEVLHFYSNLDEEPTHGHRDETLQIQDWTEEDIDALLAFLAMTSE